MAEADAWKRMVVRSMPPPAWLSSDAPHGDVALSSRSRVLRNLTGRRFPHASTQRELDEVLAEVLAACKTPGLELETFRAVTPVEREHFIACRLASHHFALDRPGRALLLNADRSLSLMVNEEDHIRLQGLTAGWSVEAAFRLSESVLKLLGNGLQFAYSPRFGYLAASPFNAGEGRRLSAMFHLIGLAHSKRLPSVIKALGARGMTARGLFGEASRAIGAFVQVSATSGPLPEFVGACEYLMREERAARREIDRATLAEKTTQAVQFVQTSSSVSLVDALRVLGWVRWSATAELPGLEVQPREVDGILSRLELRSSTREERAGMDRAVLLREQLRL